jgi:hypothetical protein
MKYRKLPVVIEAFQMTRKRRDNNNDWPDWLNAAWLRAPEKPSAAFPTVRGDPNSTMSIRTLEGVHEVSHDDWILQGVKGELYPCKPDIFDLTYEAVEEPTPSPKKKDPQ